MRGRRRRLWCNRDILRVSEFGVHARGEITGPKLERRLTIQSEHQQTAMNNYRKRHREHPVALWNTAYARENDTGDGLTHHSVFDRQLCVIACVHTIRTVGAGPRACP